MTKKGQRDGNKLEENNADKVTKRKKKRVEHGEERTVRQAGKNELD